MTKVSYVVTNANGKTTELEVIDSYSSFLKDFEIKAIIGDSTYSGAGDTDTIYTNTSRNGLYDFNGGSVNTASTIITKDKRALVGRHEWYACAKSAKFSGDQEILTVRMFRVVSYLIHQLYQTE